MKHLKRSLVVLLALALTLPGLSGCVQLKIPEGIADDIKSDLEPLINDIHKSENGGDTDANRVFIVADAINETYSIPVTFDFYASDPGNYEFYDYHFRRPMIAGTETETTRALNKKFEEIWNSTVKELTVREIYEKVKDYSEKQDPNAYGMEAIEADELDGVFLNLDYESAYKDGLLGIRLIDRYGYFYSEYDTYSLCCYYDTENDRELDLDQYLDACGYTLDKILDAFHQSKDGKALENEELGMGYKITKENVVGVLCKPDGVCTLYYSGIYSGSFVSSWDYSA